MPQKQSQSDLLFNNAVAALNKAIQTVHPSLTIDAITRQGFFEESVYMLWLATRIELYDRYLPEKRQAFLTEFIQRELAALYPSKTEFTLEQLSDVLARFSDYLVERLGSLRQSATLLRGTMFEQVMAHPLRLLLDGTLTRDGQTVSMKITARQKKMENIDLSFFVGDVGRLGLSVKGNARERAGESVERAQRARDKGVFPVVWHIILTSGAQADKSALVLGAREPQWQSERFYTWTPLWKWLLTQEPNATNVLPLHRLVADAKAELNIS